MTVTILDTMDDPALFGPWFKDRVAWAAWRVLLKAIFAIAMDPDELAIFVECTGRDVPPAFAMVEAWLVCGRRGGKSRILALIAIYLACFRDWTPYLAPGERGTILIMAADKKQGRVIYRYALGMLENVPMLKAKIEKPPTAEAIDLDGRVTIEIAAASFRTTRGYTIIAGLCDEIAFWRSDESANPDSEILDAVRPAMATVPGAMLLCASSPYARRGALWEAYKAFYGKTDAPALVWKAATRTMNPTVPQRVIDTAYERDPASASAEYGAEFRTDVETFISGEVVDACTVLERHELAPISGTSYVAFVDPSGGSADSMTLAVAHRDKNGVVILDAVRDRKPPFSPEAVVDDFCDLLKLFGVSTVEGDRYAGEWPREQFRKRGIEYRLAEKPKSDLYRDVLPILNSGKVELLDNPLLVRQLCGLERRTARGGRDSIDHAPGGHDDLINAATGAILRAAKRKPMEVPIVVPTLIYGSRNSMIDNRKPGTY